MANERKFLIWSNEQQRWWAPNSHGYTSLTHAAGRYTFDEATAIVMDTNRFGVKDGIMNDVVVAAPPQDLCDQQFYDAARASMQTFPAGHT